MEIIIFIITIVAIIAKMKKKAIPQGKEGGAGKPGQPPVRHQTVPNQSRREVVLNQSRREAVPNRPRPTTVPNQSRGEKTAAQLKEEIWSRLSDESKAKMSNRDTYQQMTINDLPKTYVSGDMSAAGQIQKRRMEERNTSILDRAKDNNADNAMDVTLSTMEAEHNHSERVSPAIHHHPEDNLQESMLGSIEDLMVKGYDGNLCFERDFLGEGLDMLSRFTVPSEIPNYSGNE